MTLDELREMRRSGVKPVVLTVVCGDEPEWLEGDQCTVFMPTNEAIEVLDFRPMVGIDVSIIDPSKDDDFLNRVVAEVHAAGARILGIAGQSGIAAENPTHERILKRKMEVLCQT